MSNENHMYMEEGEGGRINLGRENQRIERKEIPEAGESQDREGGGIWDRRITSIERKEIP